MLGVLVAVDDDGVRHTLYAFSGQLGNGGFHYPGFVEPVFDYLQPNGHFKTKEREISAINAEIAHLEANNLAHAQEEYEAMKNRLDAEIAEYKELCRVAKESRRKRRATGDADDAEIAAMIRQSQFEKAELHRRKKRAAAELQPYTDKLNHVINHIRALKEKRRTDSEALQEWLFGNFRVLDANGESYSLSEIFADTPMGIPPSGAGECCAPKLLQAAYRRGGKPVSMAEYWYGAPKEGEVRIHGQHYPACRGKCLPVLSRMLQGLDVTPPLITDARKCSYPEPEIIYRNEWFCVVNKPSGMLSVPGKGKAESLQQWLEMKYGDTAGMKVVHRLDQDTSGLIIGAFGELSFMVMQKLFASRQVSKTYIADLEGDYIRNGLAEKGVISLPLIADHLDRPRQRIDYDKGKEAITDYEFTGTSGGRSRVIFHPRTGRTHQLRVHAAALHGLGMPIVGDCLYGVNKNGKSERLHLHAYKIKFTFPIDGKEYSFESPVPF